MVLSYAAERDITSEMTTSTKEKNKNRWFGSSSDLPKHSAGDDYNIPAYLVKGKVLPPPG